MARSTTPRASAARSKTFTVTFTASTAGYGRLEAGSLRFPLGTPVLGVPANVVKALKALPGDVCLSIEPEETPAP